MNLANIPFTNFLGQIVQAPAPAPAPTLANNTEESSPPEVSVHSPAQVPAVPASAKDPAQKNQEAPATDLVLAPETSAQGEESLSNRNDDCLEEEKKDEEIAVPIQQDLIDEHVPGKDKDADLKMIEYYRAHLEDPGALDSHRSLFFDIDDVTQTDRALEDSFKNLSAELNHYNFLYPASGAREVKKMLEARKAVLYKNDGSFTSLPPTTSDSETETETEDDKKANTNIAVDSTETKNAVRPFKKRREYALPTKRNREQDCIDLTSASKKLPPPLPTGRRQSQRQLAKNSSSLSTEEKKKDPYAKRFDYKSAIPKSKRGKKGKEASPTAASLKVGPHACAAGHLCGMQNIPMNTKHICQTCKGPVCGVFCYVTPLPTEENKIFYCKKCGRPEDEPKPGDEVPLLKPPPKQTKQKPALQTKQKPQRKKGAQQKEAPKHLETTKKSRNRRSVFSRPISIAKVKDRTVRPVFRNCMEFVQKLQFCTTFEHAIDREQHPKSQHFLFTYDELVEKPHNPAFSRYRRQNPIAVFLTPEGVDEKFLGQKLVEIGKEMMKKKGKGYRCTTDSEEYFRLVFGEPDQRTGKPKGKPKGK